MRSLVIGLGIEELRTELPPLRFEDRAGGRRAPAPAPAARTERLPLPVLAVAGAAVAAVVAVAAAAVAAALGRVRRLMGVGLALSSSSEEEEEERVKGLLGEEPALVKAAESVALRGPEELPEKNAPELGDGRYEEPVSGVAAAVAGAGRRRRGGVAEADTGPAAAAAAAAEGTEAAAVVGAANTPGLPSSRSGKKTARWVDDQRRRAAAMEPGARR